MTGMIQDLFEPLSLAAAFTIGASYVLALTVVPAFCATFIRERVTAGWEVPASAERDAEGRVRPRGLYGRGLSAALRVPMLTSAVILFVVGGTFLLYPAIGSELFPEVDAGSFEIRLKTMPGTALQETEKLVARIEETIKEEIPRDQIETIIANIGLPVGKGAGFSTILSSNSGPDTAYLIVNLKQEGRRTATREYIARLRDRFADEYPLEQFLFVSGGIVNMALNEGVPVPISVQVSAGSLEQCRDSTERIVDAVRDVPGGPCRRCVPG